MYSVETCEVLWYFLIEMINVNGLNSNCTACRCGAFDGASFAPTCIRVFAPDNIYTQLD